MKQKIKRNRIVFSVYPSKEEYEILKKSITESNLSASQFFLTNALGKPLELPKRKTLPDDVRNQIVNLEKLSGLLAMAVLKTKDKNMIMNNWMISSMNVRWITNLVLLKIFEEFELFKTKAILAKLIEDTKLMYWELDLMDNEKINTRIKPLAQKNHLNIAEVSKAFNKQFETTKAPAEFKNIWASDFEVHQEIENIKKLALL